MIVFVGLGVRDWEQMMRVRVSFCSRAAASRERLRRLPLGFVAYKGNLPGKPSGERTRTGARFVYERAKLTFDSCRKLIM
jgi:hypothetical protein